jgi:hypothetical protein
MNELFNAFWDHIAECLVAGDMETRAWLDTGTELGGFLWWCVTSDVDPQAWRTLLLRVWTEGPSVKLTRTQSAGSGGT